jgi:hypothetical protein
MLKCQIKASQKLLKIDFYNDVLANNPGTKKQEKIENKVKKTTSGVYDPA